MEQVFTQEQIENKLEQLGMEVENLMYEDVSIQLTELTSIRDEINVLIKHLEDVQDENLHVVVDVPQEKLSCFEIFCSELLEELQREEEVSKNSKGFYTVEIDGVEWTFEPEAVVAEGEWQAINEDNGYFSLDDLAFFGELDIE